MEGPRAKKQKQKMTSHVNAQHPSRNPKCLTVRVPTTHVVDTAPPILPARVTEENNKKRKLEEDEFLDWFGKYDGDNVHTPKNLAIEHPNVLLLPSCPVGLKPNVEETWYDIQFYVEKWRAAKEHKDCKWNGSALCPTCSLKFSPEARKLLRYCKKDDSLRDFVRDIMDFLIKYPDHDLSLPAEKSSSTTWKDIESWQKLYLCYQEYKFSKENKRSKKELQNRNDEEFEEKLRIMDEEAQERRIQPFEEEEPYNSQEEI